MLNRTYRSILPALFLTLCTTAHAADGPPQPFARVSVASTDQVKQLVTDLKLPVPGDIAGLLEKQFSFIGSGGIDPSKPIGLMFLAGDDLTQSQMVLFAMPVNKTFATLNSLADIGAIPVPNEPDMVHINTQLAFRRTANYLFMYPGEAPALKAMDNDVFAKDYKSKETLFYGTVDLALARASAPAGYKSFLQSIKSKDTPGTAAQRRGQELGADMVINFVNKVDKISLDLSLNEQTLKVSTAIAPTPIKGQRTFPKPIFPAGALLTGHIAFPDTQSANWLADIYKLSQQAEPARTLTPDQLEQERKLTGSVASALGASATSFDVASHDGHWVVTVVNQYSDDTNLPAELKKDITAIAKIETDAGQKMDATFEDFTAPNGATGVRLKLVDHADAPAILITQLGKIATITVSEQELAAPPAIALSPTEKISDLCQLDAQLGPILKIIDQSPMAAQLPLTADQRKSLIEKLATAAISLRAINTPDGAMTIDFKIPTEVLKVVPELLGGGQ